MGLSQLVTYMKLPYEALSEPKPKEIIISTTVLNVQSQSRIYQTFVDNVIPDQTQEVYIKHRISEPGYHSIYQEQHKITVENYKKIGYQTVTHQDYEEWHRKLEEIPGLDSFGLSFEQNQLEFLKYLRDQEKI